MKETIAHLQGIGVVRLAQEDVLPQHSHSELASPPGVVEKQARRSVTQSALSNWRNQQRSREYLADVVPVYPDDRVLRLLFAAALSRTGVLDSARANARLVIEGAPATFGDRHAGEVAGARNPMRGTSA